MSNWLRDRLKPEFLEERAREEQANERMQRVFDRGLPWLNHLDQQDEALLEGGRTNRSSSNAQRRGVERLFRLESSAWQDAYSTAEEIQEFKDAYKMTPEEYRTREWMQQVEDHYKDQPYEENEQMETVDSAQARSRQDVKDNYLYGRWLAQLSQDKPIRTYPVFALYIALKSTMSLVSTRNNWQELISVFHDGPIPKKDDIVAFNLLVSELDNPADSDWILANALRIPGLLPLAESILIHYSDFVRIERTMRGEHDTDTPIPDDPEGSGLSVRYEIPFDTRVENAIQDYLASKEPVDSVAVKYGLPQKRFRAILKERGVTRPRGGDRLGKR